MKRLHAPLFLIVLSFFALGLFAVNISRAQQKSSAPQRAKQTLDQRVASLERQVSDLQKQLAALSKKITAAQKDGTNDTAKQKQPTREELLPKIVTTASQSVVSVVISKDVPLLERVLVNPFQDNPTFKDTGIRVPVYRKKGVEHKKVGAGTGFIVTKDGYIVTNKHVVSDSDASYTVLLPDGTKKDATVFYRDTANDIALIKIEGTAHKTIPLGNSDTISLGQSVIAIGNALGEFENTISVGVVSGLKRTLNASGGNGVVEELKNVIQTDAAINPGNSGGPLIDLSGKAVGVNVATVVGSQNIGFAIPINNIRDVLSRALGRE
ncbi:trypsin-like peptidase domain-containing protein [Candidatus Uhrbacteria bacterium]|nr:trypsin-like peptidase domain-containing protein [Candidatus Uhrbacteria bacterium]